MQNYVAPERGNLDKEGFKKECSWKIRNQSFTLKANFLPI